MRKQRGVWQQRDFRRLWAAATVSAFGTDITRTAFPFVAILVLDASAWQLGLLQIAAMAPAFACGLFAGAWIDRLRRRPIMIACDWTRAGVILTVPLLAWMDVLSIEYLFIVAGISSVASTFFDVADRSLLPSLVERDEIVDANRLLTGGNTVAEAGGFAASGWLVQIVSAPGALIVDAMTFVWSALMLHRIERPEREVPSDAERDPLWSEMVQGLAYVRRNPTLVAVGTSLFLMSLSMQIVGTVYLLYVNQKLGFDPGVLGLIFATGGIFSLAGSLAGGRIIGLVGVGPLLIGALFCVAAGQSLITFATSATLFAVVLMLLQQSMDLPWTLYEITQVSLRQAVTPDEWQGRMNGSFHMLEFGGYVVGALVGGLLGTEIGPRGAIIAGSIGLALAAVPLMVTPVRSLRSIPVEVPGPAR